MQAAGRIQRQGIGCTGNNSKAKTFRLRDGAGINVPRSAILWSKNAFIRRADDRFGLIVRVLLDAPGAHTKHHSKSTDVLRVVWFDHPGGELRADRVFDGPRNGRTVDGERYIFIGGEFAVEQADSGTDAQVPVAKGIEIIKRSERSTEPGAVLKKRAAVRNTRQRLEIRAVNIPCRISEEAERALR